MSILFCDAWGSRDSDGTGSPNLKLVSSDDVESYTLDRVCFKRKEASGEPFWFVISFNEPRRVKNLKIISNGRFMEIYAKRSADDSHNYIVTKRGEQMGIDSQSTTEKTSGSTDIICCHYDFASASFIELKIKIVSIKGFDGSIIEMHDIKVELEKSAKKSEGVQKSGNIRNHEGTPENQRSSRMPQITDSTIAVLLQLKSQMILDFGQLLDKKLEPIKSKLDSLEKKVDDINTEIAVVRSSLN